MIDLLFNPNGRISRKGYLVTFLGPYLFLAQILSPVLQAAGLGIISVAITLFYLWPSLVSVPVKRFHDMGVSGWYQAGIITLMIAALMVFTQGVMAEMDTDAFLQMSVTERSEAMLEAAAVSSRAKLGTNLLFFVNIAQYVLFLSVKGQPGANKFGNDPLASGRGYAD